MSKQPTPIQTLIEWVKGADKRLLSKEKKENAKFLAIWSAVLIKLKDALEEEKKFAEDAFEAGHELGAQEYNDFLKKVTAPEFPDYYKQFENE